MSFLKRFIGKARSGESRKEVLLKEIYKKRSVWAYIKPLPTCVLLGFCFLALCICFLGQSPAGPKVLPGYSARMRIVADFPFSYISQIRTQELKEQESLKLAPVYTLDMHPLTELKTFFNTLEAFLLKLEPKVELESDADRMQLVHQALKTFDGGYKTFLKADTVLALLTQLQAPERVVFFREGLAILSDVLRKGIDQYSLDTEGKPPGLSLKRVDGAEDRFPYASKTEALRALRIHLYALDYDLGLLQGLYAILKEGVEPNLVYDAEATKIKLHNTLDRIQPVEVFVPRGQVIVSPASILTEKDYEEWQAYRNCLKNQEEHTFGLNLFLMQRLLATLLIIGTTILYIKIALPHYKSSKRYRLLPALLVLVNLALIRLSVECGEWALMSSASKWVFLLPLAAPIAFAPILTTLLIGPTPGILVTILVSAFNTLMQGTDIYCFFVYCLACLIAVFLAKNTRRRTKVLWAGLASGLVFGVANSTLAYFEHETLVSALEQIAVAICVGGLSSILATGLRPLLENIFGITTDFTLLELTDFNHPILRRLQIEAPGTYHHSLMVANLAERAACKIGANPLLCRSGALFHDMGKLLRPEYFIENQAGEDNPHTGLVPSMSAIIIKSHVKEGIALALEAGLPAPIINMIREHHGTTLTEYFYQKALKQAKEDLLPEDTEDAQTLVDANAFRYEGPKPQTRESAILFFADTIEASSRSLKKVNHQSIKELIDTIFKERMAEHQLDECPLTLSEIYAIRESFTFTLLNTFHARLAYTEFPKAKPKNT
jgi:cyclic-di-AMP phosphodiesterase PgpH